jgi:ferric-dicitrate binding protein FerR (iron transport regulator)
MSTPCEEIRPELEALLGAMSEGQLDAQGTKRLSQILREHPDARQFYLDYCQMHALLQSAHGVLQALENPAVGRRRLLAGLAAAAAVLVVVGAVFLAKGREPIDASVAMVQGSAWVLRDDRKVAVADIREMRAGDRILTSPEARTELRYKDGTQVLLMEKTEIRLRDDGRARMELREGTLRCEVTPQPAERPFIVSTPQADAIVIGTSFDLTSGTEETRLQTRSGRVRLTSEGRTVEVGPGERGTATAAGVVRWVPVQNLDFTRMSELPASLETTFCESATHLTPNRKIERVFDRLRFGKDGLSFVQERNHGLVVLEGKDPIGEDVILEADVAGGQQWSLQLSVSGDAFEGYRVVFAAIDEYPNGIAVDTISAKELMVLARDPRPISYDKDHTVRVERRGSRIRAWIDGQIRIDTEVTQPLPENRRRTFSMSNFGATPNVRALRVWTPATTSP